MEIIKQTRQTIPPPKNIKKNLRIQSNLSPIPTSLWLDISKAERAVVGPASTLSSQNPLGLGLDLPWRLLACGRMLHNHYLPICASISKRDLDTLYLELQAHRGPPSSLPLIYPFSCLFKDIHQASALCTLSWDSR